MLTEYKIKIEKDGLTITQRIEPTSSQTPQTFLGGNSLPSSYQQCQNPNSGETTRIGCSEVKAPPGGGGGFEAIPGGGGFDTIPGEGGFKAILGEDGLSATSGELASMGAAPITIIGPNIFMCCSCSKSHQENEG
jgi:hypothetical protein